jgi:hypothetical protein
MMRTLGIAFTLVLGIACGAAAQDVTPPQGPLVLEPVHSPFVVAPEYKITNVDGHTGHLLGGYAGQLIDDRLLIGGALYTLVDDGHHSDLTYGGFLIGWVIHPSGRIRFGARGLVGGGGATLGSDVPVVFGGYPDHRNDPRYYNPTTGVVRVYGHDDFMVFEPQANTVIHFNEHIGADLSVGYRATAFDDFAGDRLHGVTGSFAVQFGW